TYIAGTAPTLAEIHAIAIDPANDDVVVAGNSGPGSSLPVSAGAYQPASQDLFIARLPKELTSISALTYYGGTQHFPPSDAAAVRVIGGDIYFAGAARPDLAGTTGGFQPGHGAGANDGFIARFQSDLSVLKQASFLGSNGEEEIYDLQALASTGEVYALGITNSSNLPGTAGGAQPARGGSYDAFVARVSA